MEKETFIIRTEWYKSISKLGVEEKAMLLDNLFNYHNLNNNLINLNNPMVDLVWGLIEPNLRRNIESYDARKQSSVENGKLGGRPKKEAKSDENNLNNLNKPNDKTQEPNETLSVSDSVSVSVSESVPVSESVIVEINTEASPSFSDIPFSESEDIHLEPEEEKRKKVAPKKEKEFAEVMKSDLDIAYDAFVEMRKKMKGGVTEYALKLIRKELITLSQGDEVTMISILNQSTMNSWKGVFPLKNQNQFQQATPVSKSQQVSEALAQAKENLKILYPNG